MAAEEKAEDLTPGSSENRFERWLVAARARPKFSIMIILLLIGLMELFAVGVLAINDHLRGAPGDFHFRHLLVTSFIAPRDDVELMAPVEYLGELESAATKREWQLAHPVRGWQYPRSAAVRKKLRGKENVRGLMITNNQGFMSSGELDFQ